MIKFSATLLNTFSLFLNDEGDYYTEQKVLDSINRNIVMTDKMNIGKQFGEMLYDKLPHNEEIVICGQSIRPDIINAIRKEIDIENASAEVYCEIMIDNNIKLYGYADFVNRRLFEVKTTSTIDYMKYKNMVQHKVYSLALNLPDTCYIITDFNTWTKEEYLLNLIQVKHELYLLSRRFVEFIDSHKESINFEFITVK